MKKVYKTIKIMQFEDDEMEKWKLDELNKAIFECMATGWTEDMVFRVIKHSLLKRPKNFDPNRSRSLNYESFYEQRGEYY